MFATATALRIGVS